MIEHAPRTLCTMRFAEAWLYCLTLSHNGHKDWRMPTYFETSNGWNSSDVPDFDQKSKYQYSITPVRDVCSNLDQK